jgi:hypothetical protein
MPSGGQSSRAVDSGDASGEAGDGNRCPSARFDPRMQDRGRCLAWRHLLPVTGLLCLCVAWPVFLAVLTGSLAIPHNDAWAHSLIAQHFARSGSFELIGWNRSALDTNATDGSTPSGTATGKMTYP